MRVALLPRPFDPSIRLHPRCTVAGGTDRSISLPLCKPCSAPSPPCPCPPMPQRIFHGRGAATRAASTGCWNAYPPVLVLTSFLPATDETEAQLAAIGQALAERWDDAGPRASR